MYMYVCVCTVHVYISTCAVAGGEVPLLTKFIALCPTRIISGYTEPTERSREGVRERERDHYNYYYYYFNFFLTQIHKEYQLVHTSQHLDINC